ncbi:MAG: hypothetical protein KJ734_15160, partial [Chloroflexi bacterium]|nr:hypothetical protein [Chloroflexota bacterium]
TVMLLAGCNQAEPSASPLPSTPVPATGTAVPPATAIPGETTIDLTGPIKADNVKHLQSLYALTGYAIAFSPKDPVLATGGLDGSVKVWNLDDGSLVQDLTKLNDMIFDLAYSPDSALLAGAAGGKPMSWTPPVVK